MGAGIDGHLAGMTLAIHSSVVRVTPDALFRFHLRPSSVSLISPPFPRLAVLDPREPAEEGDVQRLVLRAGPFSLRWEARVRTIIPGSLIEDVQERGPFRHWSHQHRFKRHEEGSLLTDAISFSLFPSRAGEFLDYLVVRPAIVLVLAWRHRRTRAVLQRVEAASAPRGRWWPSRIRWRPRVRI